MDLQKQFNDIFSSFPPQPIQPQPQPIQPQSSILPSPPIHQSDSIKILHQHLVQKNTNKNSPAITEFVTRSISPTAQKKRTKRSLPSPSNIIDTPFGKAQKKQKKDSVTCTAKANSFSVCSQISSYITLDGITHLCNLHIK